MGDIRHMIDNNHFNFKKKYGQNFLMDDNILNKIVRMANLENQTLVIEIGVGSGNLTKKVANEAEHVIGYEIDKTLEPLITESLGNYDNVDIIYDDFLKRDVKTDLLKYNYSHIYVIANLPYYITTPIITKLIEEDVPIEKMVIMVQKEVGGRLSAKPDSKDYNSLSIFINYYFEVSKLFDVSKNAFIPKPNVDSSIIQLKRREALLPINDTKLFFRLIRDAFKYKRKTLRNNLKSYNLDLILATLKKYNLDLNVRAEHLTMEQFVDIANNL